MVRYVKCARCNCKMKQNTKNFTQKGTGKWNVNCHDCAQYYKEYAANYRYLKANIGGFNNIKEQMNRPQMRYGEYAYLVPLDKVKEFCLNINDFPKI